MENTSDAADLEGYWEDRDIGKGLILTMNTNAEFNLSSIQEIDFDVESIIADLADQQEIDFDTENILVDPNLLPKVMGFHTTPEGHHFLGCLAGGDWEHPVFLVLYTDKTGKAQMYIPRGGDEILATLDGWFDDDQDMWKGD